MDRSLALGLTVAEARRVAPSLVDTLFEANMLLMSHNDEPFDESKHPRASDGRFGTKAGDHEVKAGGAKDVNLPEDFGRHLASDKDGMPRGDLQGIIEAKFPNLADQERALKAHDEYREAQASTKEPSKETVAKARTATGKPRPPREIAEEIKRDWKNVAPEAKPYIQAMMEMDTWEHGLMADSGATVALYALGNLTRWKGETARRVKEELKHVSKMGRNSGDAVLEANIWLTMNAIPPKKEDDAGDEESTKPPQPVNDKPDAQEPNVDVPEGTDAEADANRPPGDVPGAQVAGEDLDQTVGMKGAAPEESGRGMDDKNLNPDAEKPPQPDSQQVQDPAGRMNAIRGVVQAGSPSDVDGTSIDAFTATAITQVYDALKPENQERLARMPIHKMADVAFKLFDSAGGGLQSLQTAPPQPQQTEPGPEATAQPPPGGNPASTEPLAQAPDAEEPGAEEGELDAPLPGVEETAETPAATGEESLETAPAAEPAEPAAEGAEEQPEDEAVKAKKPTKKPAFAGNAVEDANEFLGKPVDAVYAANKWLAENGFDETKHPRQGGKFAAKGTAMPAHKEETEEQRRARIQKARDFVAGLAKKEAVRDAKRRAAKRPADYGQRPLVGNAVEAAQTRLAANP